MADVSHELAALRYVVVRGKFFIIFHRLIWHSLYKRFFFALTVDVKCQKNYFFGRKTKTDFSVWLKIKQKKNSAWNVGNIKREKINWDSFNEHWRYFNMKIFVQRKWRELELRENVWKFNENRKLKVKGELKRRFKNKILKCL